MARQQHNTSVSLFPFLAVLVCTMGALILLLLVTTRQIRKDQRDAVQMDLPSDSDLPPAALTSETTTQNDIVVRSAILADCEQQLAQVEHQCEQVRRHIIELEADLEFATEEYHASITLLQSVRQDVAQMQAEAAAQGDVDGSAALVASFQKAAELQTKQQAAEANLTDLNQRLQDERQKLIALTDQAELKEQQLFAQRSALLTLRKQATSAAQQSQVTTGTETIVEFSNSTGTSRTPIIINLTEVGFEFLPNGIRLTERDLQGFPIKDNPLLSAVLTIHRYRSRDSAVSEPYVLLLVRPDGSLPFYTAQRVFSASDIHYGYELLEPDQEVSVEPADNEELRLVRRAVLENLNKRETLYAVLRGQMAAGQQGATDHAKDETRQLVIRPDGRVESNESRPGRPVDGRFYAGGVAPPRSLYRSRDRISTTSPVPNPDSPAASDAAPDRRASFGPDTNAAADSNDNPGTETRVQSFSPSEIKDTDSAAKSPATSGQIGRDDVSRDMAEFLKSLGSNLERSTAASGQNSAAASDHSMADNTIHSNTIATKNSQQLIADAAGTMATAGPQSSAEGSSGESPVGPQSAVASANASESANAGATFPSIASGSAGDTVMGGAAPRSVDQSHVDPKLLEMLDAPQRRSTEYSTPVGITVFLDANHMTVGQRSSQLVNPSTMEAPFGFLLRSISEDVDAVRKSPHQPLLPIVKFVVSPGGEQTRIRLARELREIGIPSAAVFSLEPHVTVMDGVGRASLEDARASALSKEPTGRKVDESGNDLPWLPPLDAPSIDATEIQ